MAGFLANSLGLIPSKGKGDVAVALLVLFDEAAQIREGRLEGVEVKDGGLKVDDILKVLKARGINIGKAQFYATYLRRFLDAGIIVKKPHSRYGLKGGSLSDTLRELYREIKIVWEKVVEHAERLDREIRVSLKSGK